MNSVYVETSQLTYSYLIINQNIVFVKCKLIFLNKIHAFIFKFIYFLNIYLFI